jgi:hypothetical protein
MEKDGEKKKEKKRGGGRRRKEREKSTRKVEGCSSEWVRGSHLQFHYDIEEVLCPDDILQLDDVRMV